MSSAIHETLTTPDGPFTVLADTDGSVMASGWTDDIASLVARLRPASRPERLVAGSMPSAAASVRAYYDGDLGALESVAVSLHGTEMQVRGWTALRGISPGAPLSYAEFAEALGSPSAVRAAASICARNAAALFVPCHRVLRSDGSLGGFAWGLDIKRSLLGREAGA